MRSSPTKKFIEIYNVSVTCQCLYNVYVMQQTQGHATHKGYQPVASEG